MNYWLLKSEPTAYSIGNLERDTHTAWEGVRNYQARNFMKEMALGDMVLFYHSSAEPMGVFGTAKVVGAAHPDQSQFNKADSHFDPKATKETPIWYCVDIAFAKKFKAPVLLGAIKAEPSLRGIILAQPGSRLSVQPVSKAHFERIVEMGTGRLV